MSALTDLFTALANKIRSKTGTATTYTPLQMVSDGIDDVYAAGYDAGGGGATGTPITPSNSSPASMTSGTTYEAQANGYAIASYSSATPSNANPFFMQEDEYYKLSPGWAGGYLIGTYDQITPSDSSPASLTSGNIYKMSGAGKAVASVTDITPSTNMPSLTAGQIYKPSSGGYAISAYTALTPSDSSPVALSAQTIYRVTNGSNGGYAIESSPSTITPNNTSPPSIASDTIYKGGGTGKAIASIATNGNGVTPSSSGKYFYSGWNRMTSAGYAYSSQPSSGYTYGWNSETTLWANSSPTSSFGAQNVTLSQSIQNFNYIKIICRASTSVSTTSEAIFSKSFVLSCVSGNAAPRMALSTRTGSQSYVRIINYASDTQIYFDTAHKRATSGDTNGYVIPTSIVGLK